MKKSFLLFPFAAMVLAACSNSSTEATNAEVTEANSSWQTEVQPAEMPSSMSQPVYNNPQQQTYSAPQPTTPVAQPSYGQTGYNQPTYSGNAETIGNCHVVRDGNNTPIYSQIQKGCYTGDSYTVGKSDTIFLIGYLTGKTVDEIAALNNLVQPYQLKVGQVLRVR